MGFKKEAGDRVSCNKKHRERRPLGPDFIDDLKRQTDALNKELCCRPKNAEETSINIDDEDN